GVIPALLICVFLVVSSSPGNAQVQKINMGVDESKPELKDDDSAQMLENVPHSNMASDSMPLVSDSKITNLNETVKGLKEAGYTLDEIVTVLKNDNYEAPQISIACLKSGYNGTKIFQALEKAGFSDRQAKAAVPAALRTESQPLSVYTTNPDSVKAEMALIEPNPFTSGEINSKSETAIGQEKEKSTSNINPMEVPVSVGVKFDGLGNWSDFQNNRFGTK
ncbi:MAG: hypothetical protein L6416_01880, partial [Candidatus Omnitrophica bacterium]|nr:hypothetical protein [Candidatus Omnitrophota bacterium]